MEQNSENSVELTIPKKIGVYEDKKTRAKTIALPFKFLDGQNGVVIVTKMTKYSWTPAEDLKVVKLTFTD